MQDTADIPVSGLQENWKKKINKDIVYFYAFQQGPCWYGNWSIIVLQCSKWHDKCFGSYQQTPLFLLIFKLNMQIRHNNIMCNLRFCG